MKTPRFAAGFILDHVGKAACAASTAALTSSSEADEDFHTSLCEEGEVTEKVVEVVTSLPLMRRGTVYIVLVVKLFVFWYVAYALLLFTVRLLQHHCSNELKCVAKGYAGWNCKSRLKSMHTGIATTN